jgi:hypothetical protein
MQFIQKIHAYLPEAGLYGARRTPINFGGFSPCHIPVLGREVIWNFGA